MNCWPEIRTCCGLRTFPPPLRPTLLPGWWFFYHFYLILPGPATSWNIWTSKSDVTPQTLLRNFQRPEVLCGHFLKMRCGYPGISLRASPKTYCGQPWTHWWYSGNIREGGKKLAFFENLWKSLQGPFKLFEGPSQGWKMMLAYARWEHKVKGGRGKPISGYRTQMHFSWAQIQITLPNLGYSKWKLQAIFSPEALLLTHYQQHQFVWRNSEYEEKPFHP